jgi:16S rRNA (guanine527-N7)-methyltransferase
MELIRKIGYLITFRSFYPRVIVIVSPPDETLSAALIRHQISLPPEQVALLERYCALLWEWNAKINLTRHTDYEKFVGRDVADSLVFSRFLRHGERVLDVGSGGGVPGVLLTVLRPDLSVTLSESVAKRAKVLADLVGRLELAVPIHAGRAEELLQKEHFQSLVIRAVAPLGKLLTWFKPYWRAFDRLLILKGPGWVDERGAARHLGLFHGLALRKLHAYPLPGSQAESVLLLVCPKDRLEDQLDQGDATE